MIDPKITPIILKVEARVAPLQQTIKLVTAVRYEHIRQAARLLNLPAELCEVILEDVLDTPDAAAAASQDLGFREHVLALIPPVLHVCFQLRNEAGPIFFASRAINFGTLKDLDRALLSSPGTLKWWNSIHIELSSHRVPLSEFSEQIWKPAPCLDILNRVPNLKNVWLDGIVAIARSKQPESGRSRHGCGATMAKPQKRRNNTGPQPPPPTPAPESAQEPWSVRRRQCDLVLKEREVHRIVWELERSLPREHPKSDSFEISRVLKHIWSIVFRDRRKDVIRAFRDMYRKHEEQAGAVERWKQVRPETAPREV